MEPAIYNFPAIVQGDSFGNVAEQGGNITVVPFTMRCSYSLTGWGVKVVFNSPSIVGPALELSTEDGGITIDDTLVSFTVFEMELEPGTYSYNIEFINPEGKVMTFFKGLLNVLKDNR